MTMTGISPAPRTASRADALPGLVMGDAARPASREHGVPGKLFIAFGYGTAAVSAVTAIVLALAIAASVDLPGSFWRQVLTAAAWAVLQWRVASEVRRFSRWGWYGAMGELGIASVTKIVSIFLVPQAAFVFLFLVGINAGLMRYFWKRRAQFDVDLGG